MQTLLTLPSEESPDIARRVSWFVVAHILFWFLLGWFTKPNYPIDTVVMLAWGHEWQWGYYKHPPLPAWIAEVAFQCTGGSQTGVMLIPWLASGVSLWCVWQLARRVVPTGLAALAAVLLESSYYFNLEAYELNNNTIVRPFWTLTALLVYLAVFERRWWAWGVGGLCLGLGMLAKYDIAILAIVLLLYSVVDPVGRKSWRTGGPGLLLGCALLPVLLHFQWLWKSDFSTIRYLTARALAERNWMDHFRLPLLFVGSQLAAIVPMIAASFPIWPRRLKLRRWKSDLAANHRYVLVIAFGPLLLTLLLAGIFCVQLKPMWAGPLITWLPLALLILVPMESSPLGIRRVWQWTFVFAAILAVLSVVHDVGGPYLRHNGSRVNFAGRELTREVHERWQVLSDEPLRIVAGDTWLAENVAAYSAERPTVYDGLSSAWSPWTSDMALKSQGGVILFADTMAAEDFNRLVERFRNAQQLEPFDVPWKTGASLRPTRVRIAIVVPESKMK
jgi:4-amino-4-deoxy-L-arabinose transferase-like glycosyltransferase